MANDEAATVSLALSKLGRSPGVGQSVPPEDYAAVAAHIRRVASALAAESIVRIANLADVPEEYFDQFCTLVAAAVAPEFDVQPDNAVKETAKQEIRRIVAGTPTYEVLRVNYF